MNILPICLQQKNREPSQKEGHLYLLNRFANNESMSWYEKFNANSILWMQDFNVTCDMSTIAHERAILVFWKIQQNKLLSTFRDMACNSSNVLFFCF